METAKTRKVLPRWAVLTLIWLGPMLVLWLIWRVGFHYYLMAITWLLYVLIPGLCVTRLIFLFRGRRKGTKKRKGWVVGLIAALYTLVFCCSLFLGVFGPCRTYRSTSRKAAEAFEKAAGTRIEAFLPLELGEPKSVVFHDYLYSALFWDEGSYILQCRYGAEEYEAAKSAVEARYTFRTEPISLVYREDPSAEPVITLKNDVFRFLSPADGEEPYFVHSGILLVTNDKSCEICYVVLRDEDTDIVSDLNEYLYRSCGWEFVRYGFSRFLPEVLIW